MSPQTGLHRPFIRSAMAAPYLTREQERDYAIRWRDRGDRSALDGIVRAHLRLVIALAARFRNYGLPQSDLIQEGSIGLLQAAERFDVERDVRFSTYASWWIRASIQEFILKNWSIVRSGTSSGQKALFFNFRRLRAEIERRVHEGEALDPRAEIAAKLKVSPDDVAQMEMRLSGGDISFQAPLTDDAGSPVDRLALLASDAPLPDEVTARSIDGQRRLQWLHAALAALSERERNVVQARRLAEHSVTLESLGRQFGVSKERVRQIETRAIEKLRAVLATRTPSLTN